MPLFGVTLLRDLNDDERSTLADLVSALGGVIPLTGTGTPEPSSVTPQTPGNLLNGDVPYGEIHIVWENGVPKKAYDPRKAESLVNVPQAFWDDVTQNAPQDLWAPLAYLGYTESGYNEHADILDTNDERSRGYFQINGINRKYDNDSLLVGSINVRAAVDIYGEQGWGAWYNSAKELGFI